MIRSPYSRDGINGKKVRVKAVTPDGREFDGVTKIQTSGLNPEGLMSIDIVFEYATVPVPERAQSVFCLSEKQAKRLRRSDSPEYDFIYEGVLRASTASESTD